MCDVTVHFSKSHRNKKMLVTERGSSVTSIHLVSLIDTRRNSLLFVPECGTLVRRDSKSVPAQEIRPCRLPRPFQPTILERNFKARVNLFLIIEPNSPRCSIILRIDMNICSCLLHNIYCLISLFLYYNSSFPKK